MFLNRVPCLRDIQKTRRRWKARVASPEAFGTSATDPQHWYSFHHGGRNEGQFNVGMFTDHLRVGMGFEFSQEKGGHPTVVQLVYSCFLNVLRNDRMAFEDFVIGNQLEARFFSVGGQTLQIIPTAEVVPLLVDLRQEPLWLFVGRLLRPGQDAALRSGSALAGVMESVLCGFRPMW